MIIKAIIVPESVAIRRFFARLAGTRRERAASPQNHCNLEVFVSSRVKMRVRALLREKRWRNEEHSVRYKNESPTESLRCLKNEDF
jgi:hypothetical protein